MDTISLCIVSLIWGQLSTQLFFRSWMGVLGSLCCLLGLVRRIKPKRFLFSLLFSQFTGTAFFGLFLFVGFYVLYYRLAFGTTETEVMVFVISATVRMAFVIPQISKALDEIWKSVHD